MLFDVRTLPAYTWVFDLVSADEQTRSAALDRHIALLWRRYESRPTGTLADPVGAYTAKDTRLSAADAVARLEAMTPLRAAQHLSSRPVDAAARFLTAMSPDAAALVLGARPGGWPNQSLITALPTAYVADLLPRMPPRDRAEVRWVVETHRFDTAAEAARTVAAAVDIARVGAAGTAAAAADIARVGAAGTAAADAAEIARVDTDGGAAAHAAHAAEAS